MMEAQHQHHQQQQQVHTYGFGSAYLVDERLRPLFLKLCFVLDELTGIEQGKVELNYRTIGKLQNLLHRIDEKYSQAAFRKADGTICEGQAVLSEMLNTAHEIIHLLVSELPDEYPETDFDKAYVPLVKKLNKIIQVVDTLKEQQAPVFSTKTVGKIQNDLRAIDDKFRGLPLLDPATGKVPLGQADVADMIYKLYDEIHELAQHSSAEALDFPVDAKLEPLKFKLHAIIEKLEILQTKNANKLTTQELGRIQNRLSQVDDMYNTAAFRQGETIPKGQAVVTELLEEAHEMVHDLLVKMETEAVSAS